MNAPVLNAPRIVRLNAADNVVVAVDPIDAGAGVEGVTAKARVMRGHKMATTAIPKGAPILKFGQIIGFASTDIAPGDWVHEHNVEMHDFARDYQFAEGARQEEILPVELQATFQGYRRANGKVGTRNYIAILTSVNCSATVARFMAEEINRSGLLADYPNIDGVIPLVQGGGCALDIKGEGYEVLKRTQWGYATQPERGRRRHGRPRLRGLPDRPLEGSLRHPGERDLPLHDHPGDRRHRRRPSRPASSASRPCCHGESATRETAPASELMLALQCGGSDGYSGITANPALGAAVDKLVRHGGTAILSETPEIYGAEHLLTRRAATARSARSSSA